MIYTHFSRQISPVKICLHIIHVDGYRKAPMCGNKVQRAARWQHFTSSLPAKCLPNNQTQIFAYFMNKPVILSHNWQMICKRAKIIPIFIKYVGVNSKKAARNITNIRLWAGPVSGRILLLMRDFGPGRLKLSVRIIWREYDFFLVLEVDFGVQNIHGFGYIVGNYSIQI